MTISLLYFFVEWCSKIMDKKFQINLIKIEDVTVIFVISVLHYGRGGQMPPERVEGPWGAKGLPSPPQELEGRARSALNF